MLQSRSDSQMCLPRLLEHEERFEPLKSYPEHRDGLQTSRRPPFECISLVLQGGGALGAYQAGVYEALAEAGIHPDWIAGISIGAINGALIAGNAPDVRVEKLRAFWEGITAESSSSWGGWGTLLASKGDAGRSWLSHWHAGLALVAGAPGFFTPRFPPSWLHPSGTADATSFYDTSRLKATL